MSRKKIIIIAVVSLVFLTVLSTSITILVMNVINNKNNPSVEPKIEIINEVEEVEKNNIKIIEKTDKAETENIIIDISYPQVSGLYLKDVEDKINLVLFNHYKDFKDSNLVELNSMFEEISKEFVQNKYGITEKFYTKLQSGDVLSIVFLDYTYAGGAHGMSYQSSYTFNLNTGEQYKLKDLFKPDTDYISILSAKVDAQFNPEYLLTEFEKISDNQSFYIENNKLVIYFQLYEYTPYAYGIPEIKVPLSQILTLLDDDVRKIIFDSNAVDEYDGFNVERIENGGIAYPKVTSIVGELKIEDINKDIQNLIGRYSKVKENSSGLKLDYEIGYVGDDYISFLFRGVQKYENGEYQLLDSLNYDTKTGYIITGENLFNHRDNYMKSLNRTLSNYSKKPVEFVDWMGIYFKDNNIILYHLENDFSIDYTEITVPKNEIKPFINMIIEPLSIEKI